MAYSKEFITKSHYFMESKFDWWMKWLTRKLIFFFLTEGQILTVSFSSIPWCLQFWWNIHWRDSEKYEHQIEWAQYVIRKNWNPQKHLNKKLFDYLNGTCIYNAWVKNFMSKILDVYFIPLLKPTLSNQINSDLLYFFRKGIT